MGIIKQLSLSESFKIAAGEVVERPANVIKELIENALDAGASTISVYIEDGGQKNIRVVDDGRGMDEDDAHMCFAHHATSKITTVDELYGLQSFGFRGEALTSIAAVSKVLLITKDQFSDAGIKIYKQGQEILKKEYVAAPRGTDITVYDLFYNVPARKKFLKTYQTELRAITQLFYAFCFDYPAVNFRLYSENILLHNIPQVDSLEKRVKQIWNIQDLINVPEQNSEAGSLYGIISGRHHYRYDRGNIFFFVNKRWVKNNTLGKALLKGYLNVLPPDRYPVAVLSLTIDPAALDVNIHPRKEEVQFLHPRKIESLLYETSRKMLEDSLSAQMRSDASLTVGASAQKNSYIPQYANNFSYVSPYQIFSESEKKAFGPGEHASRMLLGKPDQVVGSLSSNQNNIVLNDTNINPVKQTRCVDIDDESQQYIFLGIYKNTYIMLEQRNNLILIDQHAAHERIMYERFKGRFGKIETVSLIFPAIINLSEDEFNKAKTLNTLLVNHGLILEEFGHNTFVINAIPVYLKNVVLQDLVKEILALMDEVDSSETDSLAIINEKIHAQMACKAAVKAGDVLTQEHIKQLIDDLYKISNRFVCPHGRPTIWNISDYEIEKKFKRV